MIHEIVTQLCGVELRSGTVAYTQCRDGGNSHISSRTVDIILNGPRLTISFNWNMSTTNEVIFHYQRKIAKHYLNPKVVLHCLRKLAKDPVGVQHLGETGIRRTIRDIRYHERSVGEEAQSLHNRWKVMTTTEQETKSSRKRHHDDADSVCSTDVEAKNICRNQGREQRREEEQQDVAHCIAANVVKPADVESVVRGRTPTGVKNLSSPVLQKASSKDGDRGQRFVAEIMKTNRREALSSSSSRSSSSLAGRKKPKAPLMRKTLKLIQNLRLRRM